MISYYKQKIQANFTITLV